MEYEGKDLPWWVYASWAFGLFAYQSEFIVLCVTCCC